MSTNLDKTCDIEICECSERSLNCNVSHILSNRKFDHLIHFFHAKETHVLQETLLICNTSHISGNDVYFLLLSSDHNLRERGLESILT